ncbi:ankyrin repeat-containing domain protein [Baffinella frigidus]|nr:ankyrin repeat-containing domain protein [Cryptophyta sp. CCMP2293]
MLTLDAGASPNARGSHSKKAAVQWVVERRCTALLRTFLELGVSLDTHMTLLASAVHNKHHSMEMAALLLETGVSVDSHRTKQGRNALEAAVVSGHTAMVRYLVSKGADINLQNPYDGRAACSPRATRT